MDMMKFFGTILIIQLFWSMSITMVTATIPSAQLPYINMFAESADSSTLSSLGNTLQTSVQNQTNIPLIDLGALIFYSGNMILDLMINFFTAVPAMFTLLLSGIFIFMPVDATLQFWLKAFAFTGVAVIYFLGVIEFIGNFRSSGGIR